MCGLLAVALKKIPQWAALGHQGLSFFWLTIECKIEEYMCCHLAVASKNIPHVSKKHSTHKQDMCIRVVGNNIIDDLQLSFLSTSTQLPLQFVEY
jgi:hypothetical protein